MATLGAMSLVDSWGRRKLLVGSVSVMGLSLVVIAACESAASVHGRLWLWLGAEGLGSGVLWGLSASLEPKSQTGNSP